MNIRPWLHGTQLEFFSSPVTDDAFIFIRVSTDLKNPYTKSRGSICPMSVPCLELAKYFKYFE
jgi:hypothetical protein